VLTASSTHGERACSKCGSARTSVVAQSASPPGEFVQCQACGHSSLVPHSAPATAKAGAPPSGDVDKRRIERLVITVIDERRLLCQLQSVDRSNGGWRVLIRTKAGTFLKLDVPADSMSAMRAAIARGLAVEPA
jgi:hypothetical protein